jgi:type VI secretion system ImpM family protein
MPAGDHHGCAVSRWLGKAAVLGKAPWRAEFLRVSGRSSELRSFDDWVFRNGSALTEPPSESSSVSHGFVIRPEHADPALCGIAGVLAPSHDSAGRPYPLCIAAPIAFDADVGSHPEAAPIILESYWDLAIDILTEVRAAPLAAEDATLDALTERGIEPGAGAIDLYGDWLKRTNIADFCALLERPRDWLDRALLAIGDAAADPRRREGSRRSPHADSIRLPLGQAGGSALCFWLDVVRRAARWSARVPSFFWSHDGQLGDALILLDLPTDKTLAALWHVGRAHDVCDLTPPDACPPVMGLDLAEDGPSQSDSGARVAETLWTLLGRIDLRAPSNR